MNAGRSRRPPNMYGQDDEKLIAHFRLKAQGREGPENDTGRDEKGGVKNCLACGGNPFDDRLSQVPPSLSDVFLDGSRDDIDPVILAKADSQTDDRQSIHVQTDIQILSEQ